MINTNVSISIRKLFFKVVFPAIFYVGGISANAQTVFFEDFGSTTVRLTSPYMPTGSYIFGAPYNAVSNTDYNSYAIDNNHYAVIAPGYIKEGVKSNEFYIWTAAHNATGTAANGSNAETTVVKDMSGTSTGAVMVINAGTTLASFYGRNVTLEAGASYKVSFYSYLVNSPMRVGLDVKDVVTGSVLGSVSYAYVNSANTGGNWGVHYEMYFSMPSATSNCVSNQV